PAQIKDFVDLAPSGSIDAALPAEQERLKEALRKRLGGANVFETRSTRLVPARDSQGQPTADVTTDHLAQLCSDVESRLTQIIKGQIEEYWNKTAQASTERAVRELTIEQDEHERFGRERGGEDSFVGRQTELLAILDYVRNDSPWPLAVHGASGCGKTALLARAVRELQKSADAASPSPLVPRHSPLLYRFIGVTPRSSDVRSLLGSLCQELRLRHPREGELPADTKALREELHEQFRAATSEQPLILFLDALDQLSDADGGRLLNWIPIGQLPPHVKLVVSSLSDRAENDPAGQPFAELTRRQLIEKNSINLDALSESEARTLLFDRWLHQAGRTVSPDQRERIGQRLASAVCRQPIYLKLLFEEARLWRSYDTASELGESVPALLKQLFGRLSQPANHGPLLVERVLGYLAASRHGLAENEILELLFADPEYKAALDQATEQTRHELPASATRIPIAIWSRLRFDLAPYLTERAAPSATVLTFYHRQVGEWVRVSDLEPVRINWRPHERLADFFERKADPAQDSTWKTASSRALEELPYHLAQDANVPRWERTVCDPLFVEGSCRAGLVFEFLRDVDDGLSRLRSASVQLMRKAVASSLRTITKHPEFCLSILCNRLLWAEPNGLIAQAAARAAAALDVSGAWLQAASPLHAVESIPLDDRSHQAFIAEQLAFATADGSGNLEIRSIGRGELLAKRTLPSRTLTALAVEPAQFLAAWLDRNGDIRAEFSQSMLPGRAHETAVAYPRDDAVIAVSREGDLVAWNPRLGETTVLAASIPYPLVALRTNPDGSRILFVAGDRPSAQTLGVVSRSGRSWGIDKLRWNGRPVKHGCLNPDGTRSLLVDSSRGMSIVEVATGIVLASTQYERRSDVMAWGGITACALGNGRENETAVVTTDKGQVWAWNWKLDRFTACGNFKGLQEDAAVYLLEIMPEGSRIFLSTANRAAFFSTDGGPSAVPHSAAVADCAITETELVGSVCREDRALKWWRFDGLAPLRSFPVEPPRVVAADANEDCVFLGTDNGLLYRFPASRAPESKDIFRLFDHPVANIVSDRPGVAIAASTQGLIERVDFVADRSEWLCSYTSGHRQQWLLPRAAGAYITVRESETAGRGDVVALATGQNRERELYKSNYSSVLVAASREGDYLVIYDRALKDDRLLKVFKLDGDKLTPVFAADANRSICAMHLLLGDEYLLLAQRDEPWLELRRLEPGVPLAAVLELPSAPSCLCARQDKIAIGFQSGDLLCVRVRDDSRAKPILKL
ncbi:MAG: ATP-binding protein, partial [Betaproteobacteria bacterium]